LAATEHTDDASFDTEATSEDPSAGVPNRSWLYPVAVLAAALLVISIAVSFAISAIQGRPAGDTSRRAMVEKAIAGIEAVIQGDGTKLATLSDETMKKQITPEFIAKLNSAGLDALFEAPQWNGDSFVVRISTSLGEGVLIGGPVPDGKNVVLFETMGKIVASKGGVSLTASGSGWLISEFAVGKSAPTSMSVSPTGTPSTTLTP
jgi:hypothetical protein